MQHESAMCKMQCINGSAGRTSWTDQLDVPFFVCLKPWPIRIFKEFSFSLYIVAASESNEVLLTSMRKGCDEKKKKTIVKIVAVH